MGTKGLRRFNAQQKPIPLSLLNFHLGNKWNMYLKTFINTLHNSFYHFLLCYPGLDMDFLLCNPDLGMGVGHMCTSKFHTLSFKIIRIHGYGSKTGHEYGIQHITLR